MDPGSTRDGHASFELPGSTPAVPPWGQRPVGPNPELESRIEGDEAVSDKVAVVLGAGGAFGPDLIRALQLQGTRAVVGVDLQVTYPVDGACYRRVNLADPKALQTFFGNLEQAIDHAGLELGPVFDLSTIQTSPTGEVDRSSMTQGKGALVAALRDLHRDVKLFYMSSAEVYGAPAGAPYSEDHPREPFNDYGREKLREEQTLLEAHGSRTEAGRLHVVALRNWTISMVEHDESAAIVEARNYNDPLVVLAEQLSRLDVRVPITDPTLEANFHVSEEVAEVCLALAGQPLDAVTWGRPFNCVGQEATHGDIVEVAYEVFAADSDSGPPWAPLVRPAIPSRIPQRAVVALGRLAEQLPFAATRDLSARLPFLYRSTHLDSTALEAEIGDQLTYPAGTPTEEAVRRLALGLRNSPGDAVNRRRYERY